MALPDWVDDARVRELGRAVRRAWHQLNQSHLGGALRPPVFALSDSTSRLGCWHLADRRLELSLPMMVNEPWGAVVEVLKHEMAHQYAHEVLRATDETAHGPAFREVCRRMGADPRARGIPEAPPEESEAGILRKVSALLALAESDNQHEAESAAAKAQSLLLKHNLAVSEAGGVDETRYSFRQLGRPSGRVPEHEHLLAGILAQHYFVEAIWVKAFRPEDGKTGSVLEICGTHENLEIACYVHEFLSATAERLWREHKKAHGIRGNRDRRKYLAGVMEGFSARLVGERRAAQERGLVWTGDPVLGGYYRRRHPHVRSVRVSGHGGGAIREHGRRDGKKIVVRRGVRGQAEKRGRLLTSG